MNPSAQEVLRSCLENLDELVMPELSSPHARSALMCTRMLINHVILRLDQEGDALATDCAEKRAMFTALAEAGALNAPCTEAVGAMLEQPEPGYTPIGVLTGRNDAWKRLTETAMNETGSNDVLAQINRQLLAQVTRESNYCAPALDGPMF